MSEAGPRVLVIDDERAIRRFLRASLVAHGYTIFEAANGQEGIVAVVTHRPDLIILDLGLPDIDGFEVTQRLREWTQTPIIILSVQEQETDKIAALDAGADDYLTKPFGVGELMARLRVALRHTNQSSDEPVFTSGELTIDLTRRLVQISDEAIQLTPTEYDLLKLMVTHAGKVLTHQQILRQVWGIGYGNDLHLLRVNISNLRRKIEPDPARPIHILTEPGVGYRLRTEI
ncbi:MAG: response regulator [Chloroflexi bacterium]|nr:response regulator [Chloroflexota bacterium]